VDDLGDEREGGIGAVGFPEVPWRRWPAAVVVEEDPFRFYDDSAI